MLIMSIDGACRRNGKPDCVSAGGVFIMQFDDAEQLEGNEVLVGTKTLTSYEVKSTNQRGELLALLMALDYTYESAQNAQIITDSEYLFNTMTKDWCGNWERKGWVTAAGEPVKNKDIWLEIMNSHRRCTNAGLDVTFYHVKGHCMSFGKVTAQTLLSQDTTGFALYSAVDCKLSSTALKDGVYAQLTDLSIKNNGFALEGPVLKRFVVLNTMADAIATKCVDAADNLMAR